MRLALLAAAATTPALLPGNASAQVMDPLRGYGFDGSPLAGGAPPVRAPRGRDNPYRDGGERPQRPQIVLASPSRLRAVAAHEGYRLATEPRRRGRAFFALAETGDGHRFELMFNAFSGAIVAQRDLGGTAVAKADGVKADVAKADVAKADAAKADAAKADATKADATKVEGGKNDAGGKAEVAAAPAQEAVRTVAAAEQDVAPLPPDASPDVVAARVEVEKAAAAESDARKLVEEKAADSRRAQVKLAEAEAASRRQTEARAAAIRRQAALLAEQKRSEERQAEMKRRAVAQAEAKLAAAKASEERAEAEMKKAEAEAAAARAALQPAEMAHAVDKPGEMAPAQDAKAAETKAAETKDAETKPVEAVSADAKPASTGGAEEPKGAEAAKAASAGEGEGGETAIAKTDKTDADKASADKASADKAGTDKAGTDEAEAAGGRRTPSPGALVDPMPTGSTGKADAAEPAEAPAAQTKP